MTNELQFYGSPETDSGLTITAKVYSEAGIQVGTDISCAEIGSEAIYLGDMPTIGAGDYAVRFMNGSTLLGHGCIFWNGSSEIDSRSIDTVIIASQAAIISEVQQSEDDIITALPSSLSAADVYAEFTSGSNENVFKADVSSLATSAQINALNNISTADVWNATSRTLTDKAGFELTATERAAIATAVEQSILNDGDGQQVLNAIVGAIGNTNIDQVALVAAIRADLERTGGAVDLIETKSEADTRQTTLVAEHNGTQASIAALPVPLTSAQVNTQVDLALSDYDAPTKSELDIAQSAIQSDITSLPSVTDVVDALTAAIVESDGNITLQQSMSLILSAVAGQTEKVSPTNWQFKTPSGAATRLDVDYDNTDFERIDVDITPSS